MSSRSCLGDSTLEELLTGRLAHEARLRLDAHADECPACFELLARLARQLPCADPRTPACAGGVARAITEPLPEPTGAGPDSTGLQGAGRRRGAVEQPPLPVGARLGRYVVQGCLGAGGMGIVYAAYDPQLDRRVAVKLLRAGLLDADRARGLLAREARAMARLSHPNAVTVHDAGVHGEQLFVVMELVDGLTLDEWCERRRPSADRVVELFGQAARGLAAAHAAGLVHRDFKPSNVLVEAAGRVRVTDFGLAHLVRGELGGRDAAPDTGLASDSAPPGGAGFEADQSPNAQPIGAEATAVVATGAGTPAYMAPEQFLGLSAGPAADQFSFCVALYQLLYRQRPFEGGDVATLRASVLGGHPRPPARRRGVPSWIEPIVLKGLQREPTARHASMEAVLAALEEGRRTPRRRLVRASALVLLAATAAVVALSPWRREAPCDAGAALAATAWGPSQRASLSAALAAAGSSNGTGAFEAVAAALDKRTRLWERTFREACEATWVHRVQSDALLDRRMACLSSRLAEQRSLVALLSQGHGDRAGAAPSAIHRLSAVEDCSDSVGLSGLVSVPPALRPRAEALEVSLGEVRAALAAARFGDALAGAERAIDEARAMPHRPLEAEALLVAARAHAERGELALAEASGRAAMRAAEAGRHDGARAWALVFLVDLVGRRLGRAEEGKQLIRDTDALVERLSDARLESAAAVSAGEVLALQGDFEGALARHARAVALLTAANAVDELLLAAALGGQGRSLAALGRHDEARSLELGALSLRERLLGAEHPEVAISLVSLGVAERHLGQLAAAREHQERALRIQLASLGAEHPAVAATRGSLAATALSTGRHEDALREYERSLAIRRERLGPHHVETLEALVDVGRVLALQGELEGAAARFGEALRLLVERPEADRTREASVLTSLATVRREQGLLNEATELAERALVLRRRALGDGHPAVAASLTELGHLARARQRHREASSLYEQARGLLEGQLGFAHPELSDALGGLGLAELALGNAARGAWLLERALGIRPPEDADPAMRAELELGLASALHVDGGNRGRVLSLTRAARANLDRVPRRRSDLRSSPLVALADPSPSRAPAPSVGPAAHSAAASTTPSPFAAPGRRARLESPPP